MNPNRHQSQGGSALGKSDLLQLYIITFEQNWQESGIVCTMIVKIQNSLSGDYEWGMVELQGDIVGAFLGQKLGTLFIKEVRDYLLFSRS